MGVEDKGWIGGEGSLADAMFDNLAEGRPPSAPRGRITEGPLADFSPEYDPIVDQREKRATFDREFHEKTARVLGNDNDFDSSTSPGGNRVIQKDTGAGQDQAINQTPESGKAGATDGGPKKDSAPTTGSRASSLMKRIKAKKGDNESGAVAETATQSVGGAPGESQGAGHNLQIKDKAPTPKEMRVGNLADNHSKSSFTGSGPKAALHDDYSKVGADEVNDLLVFAGLPPRPLNEDAFLFQKAAGIVPMIKTASGAAYLNRSDVHPLKLMAELTDTLGEDWSEWEPETIKETLVKEAGVEPSDDVMSKIMAVKIVLAAPQRFFDDAMAMEKISVALNDQSPDMSAIQDVPVEWLSNAVVIVEKLAAEGDFGAEVKKYVAARLFDQGYVVAPPKLAFADPDLGAMINDDQLRRSVLLSYKEVIASPDDFERLRETPVNIQVARLMRNHAYVLDKLDESRAQMS